MKKRPRETPKERRGSTALPYYYDAAGVIGFEYNGARLLLMKQIRPGNIAWAAVLLIAFLVVRFPLSALFFIRAINDAIRDPPATNIFMAIIEGIFWALSVVALVSAVVKVVQAAKIVGTLSSVAIASENGRH